MVSTPSPFGHALIASVISSAGTALGGFVVAFTNNPTETWVANANGMAAGIMLFLTMFELIPESMETLGVFWETVAFFFGAVVFAIINAMIHSDSFKAKIELPSSIPDLRKIQKTDLFLSALITCIAISVHNAPEGLALLFANSESSSSSSSSSYSFFSSSSSALSLTISIAAHNLAEGAAVALAAFSATRSRQRAMVLAALSGLTEPAAVVLGHFVFSSFITHWSIAFCLASVAGVMFALVVLEVLPVSQKAADKSFPVFLLGGMLLTSIPVIALK